MSDHGRECAASSVHNNYDSKVNQANDCTIYGPSSTSCERAVLHQECASVALIL
jgi:hypothetical protein